MFGIIGAMDVEVDELKKMVSSPVTTKIAGIDFVCGEIENVMVCIAQCSPGKVNAALCTQIMIDRFSVEFIVNTGVACSLSDEVRIKNIVIASDVCQYDMDSTGCGDPLGYISGLNVIKISADPAISDSLARAAISCGEKIHRGSVASGDTFIASNKLKKHIADSFGAICGEMEGGAIGQVCYANGVPFAVIRSISDGGDDNSYIDYPTFKKIAANISTAILVSFIKEQKVQLEF